MATRETVTYFAAVLVLLLSVYSCYLAVVQSDELLGWLVIDSIAIISFVASTFNRTRHSHQKQNHTKIVA
jgi:hypothetical protein